MGIHNPVTVATVAVNNQASKVGNGENKILWTNPWLARKQNGWFQLNLLPQPVRAVKCLLIVTVSD